MKIGMMWPSHDKEFGSSRDGMAYGSPIDYENQKIKKDCALHYRGGAVFLHEVLWFMSVLLRGLWMDKSAEVANIHMRTDAKNLVTTARTIHLPGQKETIHMIPMLRKGSLFRKYS